MDRKENTFTERSPSRIFRWSSVPRPPRLPRKQRKSRTSRLSLPFADRLVAGFGFELFITTRENSTKKITTSDKRQTTTQQPTTPLLTAQQRTHIEPTGLGYRRRTRYPQIAENNDSDVNKEARPGQPRTIFETSPRVRTRPIRLTRGLSHHPSFYAVGG